MFPMEVDLTAYEAGLDKAQKLSREFYQKQIEKWAKERLEEMEFEQVFLFPLGIRGFVRKRNKLALVLTWQTKVPLFEHEYKNFDTISGPPEGVENPTKAVQEQINELAKRLGVPVRIFKGQE